MKNKGKAVLYIILSAFFFSLMTLFVRLSGDLPTMQKGFFRNFVALIFATAVLVKSEEGFKYNKKNIPVLLLRAGAGTIGLIANFYAIDKLNISDAAILNKLSPFFAIIFSYAMLKEKTNIIQWLGVIIAFIGSLFVIKPGLDFALIFPSLIGLIGGLCAGLAYTAVRLLGKRGEFGPRIVFFFSAFSSLATLPFTIINFEPMSVQQLLFLLLAGLCAAVGQFSITAAYSNAPASKISIYDYTKILFSAIWGFLFLSQIPDRYSVLGYIIIISASSK